MTTRAFHFSGGALLACLILSQSHASVPPHPDLLSRIQKNEIARPYFLAHNSEIRSMGVNSSWTAPALAEAIRTGAEKVREFGPLNPPTGTYRALVLLVDFSDNVTRTSGGSYDDLLFGPSDASMRGYFRKVSYGTLDVVTLNYPGSVGWWRAPQSYSYYVNGQNGFGFYPQNAQRLVEEVVLAANSTVDYSNYDNDHDGYVDALFVIHAGSGAEWTGNNNDIWSHAWMTNTPLYLDGVHVCRYSMEPEYWQSPGDMTIGVFAHEFGHSGFGLPDLYDTDYSSAGIGQWSLMAGGCWNGPLGRSPAFPDAWSHIAMGYITPTNVTGSLPGQTINAVENVPQVFRLWTAGASGNEYFLVENRQLLGYDAYLPSSGLLVYHVDQAVPTNRDEWYPGHTSSGHYRVALEQADNLYELERNMSSGNSGDPYPGSTQARFFTGTTSPNSLAYSGSQTNVTVGNISAPAHTMTADLRVATSQEVLITVQTTPPGRSFIVDGVTYIARQTFSWVPGSTHALGIGSPQAGQPGTRYVWQSWSPDGGSQYHTVTAPSVPTTYDAYFMAEHHLTMMAGNGGIVSPSSTWYEEGSDGIEIRAIPNPGYRFVGWVGSGISSYTGSDNPAVVAVDGPITEQATFTAAAANPVRNPGFESGTADWSFVTNGVGSFTTISPGAVGTKAGRVSLTTAGNGTQLYQRDIPLEASKAYRLKFKAYSNTGHDVSVGLQKHTSPYMSYGLLNYKVNLTPSWQPFSVTFVTGGFTGTVRDARLKFWLGPYVTNGDQYFFDDVVLEKVTVPAGTAPTIVVQPVHDTVAVGGVAWFDVAGYGAPPLSFQWQRSGVNIAGATSPSYQKFGVTLADNGASYRCRITNGSGSVTSVSAILRVTSNMLANPGFELGTANWTLSRSGDAAATFSTITPGYAGAKAAKVTVTTLGKNINLKQTGFSLMSGEQYRLTFKAKSSTGRDMSVGVQKNVSPYTCYGLMGHRVNLTTTWANFTVLFNANGFTGTVTDARFMFWFTTDAVNGESYYVDEVMLERVTTPVAGVPKVTTQPMSRTAVVGQKATFSVTVTGTAPLLYQWQKSGKDIAGATSASYVTLPVTLADNGVEYRCQVKNSLGVASSNHAVLTVTVGLAKDGEVGDETTPQRFSLSQNYPNPFNPLTTIQYTVPEEGRVVMKVYNSLGQDVATLVDEVQRGGYGSVSWNAEDLPSGTYFYRMIAGRFTDTKKMVLVR